LAGWDDRLKDELLMKSSSKAKAEKALMVGRLAQKNLRSNSTWECSHDLHGRVVKQVSVIKQI